MGHASSWEGKRLPKATASFHALLGAIPGQAQVTFTHTPPPVPPPLSERCQGTNNSSRGWEGSGSWGSEVVRRRASAGEQNPSGNRFGRRS